MSVIKKYFENIRAKSPVQIILSCLLAAVVAGIVYLYISPLYRLSALQTVYCIGLPLIANVILFLPQKSIRDSVFWLYRVLLILVYVFYVIVGVDICADDIVQNGRNYTMTFPEPDRMLKLWPILWMIPVIVLAVYYLLAYAPLKKDGFRKRIADLMLLYTPHLPGLCESRKADGDAGRKKLSVVFPVVLVLIAGTAFATTLFLRYYFPSMDVEAIMFNVQFANGAFNRHILITIAGYAACVLVLCVLFAVMLVQRSRSEWIRLYSPSKKESRELELKDIGRKSTWTLPGILAAAGIICLALQIDIPGYIDNAVHDTSLYLDYYVEPTADKYRFPEKKKNLIYIYLESFENTFTSYERGGNQNYDYIPEMADLAAENVNFSNTDALGGQSVFFSTINYTMGSTVAQTSGIPVVLFNSASEAEADYTTMRRLEDILHDEGYNQIFIRGEDASFARYEEYVARYDNSMLFDYKTAQEQGWIPEDYKETWGYEDEKLFAFSKKLISDIAAKGAPFAATLYTVDTHGLEGGYRCPLCDPAIENDFAAAVRCTSRKIDDFIDWLRQQDFYEDTVVIMVGDHPVEGNRNNKVVNLEENGYVRTTYNCIINTDTVPVNEKNRVFTAMDMFPTTLAALGVEIDGGRLGLGTNLFSDVPTVCEIMGSEAFLKEIKRHSKYYKTMTSFD